MTLQDMIAIEDKAFTAWVAIADTMGLERYESKEYKAYIAACKAVNKAVIRQNTGK